MYFISKNIIIKKLILKFAAPELIYMNFAVNYFDRAL
jgi:hypothetical protein